MTWNELTVVICVSITLACFGGGYIGQKWDDIKEYFNQCIKWW